MTERNGVRVRDPVCGNVLELEEAAAMRDRAGWAHFFCSDYCRNAFRAAPDWYAQDKTPHGAATLEHGD